VLALSLADSAWALMMVAAAVGLLYLALRLNTATKAHKRSDDGSWFSCEVQELSPSGETVGKWRPARAEVVGGRITIVGTVAGDDLRPGDAPRAVVGRSERPPRGWAVFLVDGHPLLAVRVPKGEPTVDQLDALRADR
jgi:hypothetical protein